MTEPVAPASPPAEAPAGDLPEKVPWFGLRKWMIKALIQRGMGALPFGHKLNELFQRYITGGLELSLNGFRIKLDQCSRHLSFYRSLSSKPKEDFAVLELGTGWFPVLPLGLYLAGAGRIVSYDITPLLSPHTLRQVVQYFCQLQDSGELVQAFPSLKPERMKPLRDYLAQSSPPGPKEFLRQLNIELIIGDARATGLPAGSIDLACSCTVLEHIVYEDLVRLFREFKRLSTPASVMSHFIGLEDQYATFDPSISRFNFLQYTDKQFRRWNNNIIPQTRLRMADHRRAFADGGYEILREENTRGELRDLRRIKLAPEFQHHPVEDLLVTYSWLAGRPKLNC